MQKDWKDKDLYFSEEIMLLISKIVDIQPRSSKQLGIPYCTAI